MLIIDDDQWYSTFLARAFTKNGHAAKSHPTVLGAVDLVTQYQPDIVFLDVFLADGNGLELLAPLASVPNSPEIIIITGLPDDEGAKSAMNLGAWDYICKSDPFDRILLAAERALRYRIEKLAAITQGGLRNSGIVGNSQAMSRCLADAARAARTEAPVLVTGETGTGKELIARAIHENSLRKDREFVIVDCAALPTPLVESLLFGHRRGAFTGAGSDHMGLVKTADGGTLFLDEVGELPLEMQKRFLRVLQDRKFRPVGADKVEESDFRVIAATNRDLEGAVKAGEFRSDLLHRLRSVWIQTPPLRMREGDVQLLTDYFLEEFASTSRLRLSVAPDFYEALEAHDWPGNVRELFMALESAVSRAAGFSTLFSVHLPPQVRLHAGFQQNREGAHPAPLGDISGKTMEEARMAALEAIEHAYLKDLRAKHPGDLPAACKTSGLSQSRLYALLKKHGLSLAPAKPS